MSPVEIYISDLPYDGGLIKLIQIQGQLDESNVDEKAKIVYALLEEVADGTNFIFDLYGLEYMNSKSIGYLTDWYNKILQKDGQIYLAQAQENILDILDTVGLTSIIEHHNSIEEAANAMLA